MTNDFIFFYELIRKILFGHGNNEGRVEGHTPLRKWWIKFQYVEMVKNADWSL